MYFSHGRTESPLRRTLVIFVEFLLELRIIRFLFVHELPRDVRDQRHSTDRDEVAEYGDQHGHHGRHRGGVIAVAS